MSCAIVTVIYGVPLTGEVAHKILDWEEDGDPRWQEGEDGVCGFTELYSASDLMPGYCGVELDELASYCPQLVSTVRTVPTEEEKKEAQALVAALHPELRALTGEIGVYYIWHDS